MPRRVGAASVTFFAQEVPPAATVEYERAMESIAKKDNEMAIKRLNEAIKIFPNYFLASQQLGLLLVESEQYQKAISFLVKAVEINPKAGASYLALGIASLKLGRADLAIDALQRARRLDDKSFRAGVLELGRLEEVAARLPGEVEERSLEKAFRAFV